MAYMCKVIGIREVENVGRKVNLLCLVDQDHQSFTIVVDHFRKFKDIYSMVNPKLMSYGTENGASLITSFRKKEEQVCA